MLKIFWRNVKSAVPQSQPAPTSTLEVLVETREVAHAVELRFCLQDAERRALCELYRAAYNNATRFTYPDNDSPQAKLAKELHNALVVGPYEAKI